MKATRTIRAAFFSPAGIAAAVLWSGLIVIAVIGPAIWGEEAQTVDMSSARQGASAEHPLGTDALGRDVLARTLVATRVSLLTALAATAIGTLCGIPLGSSVGVVRNRRLRRVVTGVIQIFVAFPPLLVALFIVTILGPGPVSATIAVGISFIPRFARPAQTLAASVAYADYVLAARVIGVRRFSMLRRHILPNTADSLVLLVAAYMGTAVTTIAAFSFLGFGTQAPNYDWGRLLAEGLESIYVTPLPALAPGAAIFIAGLAANFLGDAIARSLNPVVLAGTRSGRSRRLSAKAPELTNSSKVPSRAQSTRGDSVVVAENLRVSFVRGDKIVEAVAGVNLDIAPGEIVGVVGESGSGKTTLALAIAGLIPYPGSTNADRLEFMGVDIMRASRRSIEHLLGTKLAMVFQDPMSSLNPSIRVGRQLGEKVEVHEAKSKKDGLALAEQGLRDVHIPAPATRARQYPHEYSGGMRQRAMIAMGLISHPALIIADEPTTALDVTVQAQILDLFREINTKHGTAVLFVSHDAAVITELCSRVVVMYAGRVVEVLPVDDLVTEAAHPYTRALVSSVVTLDSDRARPLNTIRGRPPAIDSTAKGCPFAPRCPDVIDRCIVEDPELEPIGPGRTVACWVAMARHAK